MNRYLFAGIILLGLSVVASEWQDMLVNPENTLIARLEMLKWFSFGGGVLFALIGLDH